jgi:hypothetical protein
VRAVPPNFCPSSFHFQFPFSSFYFPVEVVVMGDAKAERTCELLTTIDQALRPGKRVLALAPGMTLGGPRQLAKCRNFNAWPKGRPYIRIGTSRRSVAACGVSRQALH